MKVVLRLLKAAEGNSRAQVLHGLPGGTQKEVPIKGHLVTIGSSNSADVSLFDPGINDMHLVIANVGDKLFLRDLNTETGTRIDGDLIRNKERELRPGNIISIGQYTQIQVLIEPDLEEQPARPFPAAPAMVCRNDDSSYWPQ